ncbi:MAG: hypothetical protein KC713_01020 [Candidatus Omnitrophica bacterium]|nr:hypothetical protein [Candidatus Omnitrophota bacterium]
MKKNISIILTCMLILPCLASAQQDRIYQNSSLNAIDSIKNEIQSLIIRNKSLKAEQEKLLREMQSLEETVETKNKTVKRLKSEAQKASDIYARHKEVLEYPIEDPDQLKSEILLQESKNKFLMGQLMDVQDQQKVRKLKLADLQFEKRSLLLELKEKEFHYEEQSRKYEMEIARLQDELEFHLSQEQEIQMMLQQLQAERETFPHLIQRLKQENEDLEHKINHLNRRIEFTKRENTHLKNKRALFTKVNEGDLISSKNTLETLQEEVSQLRMAYDTLSDKAQSRLSARKEKTEILKQIVDLDKENQVLREQIATIKEQIEKAQY